MMGLGTHAGYIVAAYGLAALVIIVLILRAWVDYRVQTRALERLEARGLRRRSSGQETTP